MKSPVINPNSLELYMYGEILHSDHVCELAPDEMDFREDLDKYSQLVISESVATCILNNFAASPIGRISLSS